MSCTASPTTGQPPDVAGLERLGATRMRQYVRAWINEWDLVRLDPGYVPITDVVEAPTDYREQPELAIDDTTSYRDEPTARGRAAG